MTKSTSLLLAAAATLALTLPAFAQSNSTMPASPPPAASSAPMTSAPAQASPAPMKSMPMKKAAKPAGKKMAMAGGKMKLTCGDYAWQSQDQKDCEAGNKKPPNWR